MSESMNGQPVFVAENGSTLFIPIPRELALDIEGGCTCEYCKAHPDIKPKWDTLAIALKPKKHGEHTWTVHNPELQRGGHGVKMWGWK